MRTRHFTLRATDVQAHAATLLQANLRLQDYSTKTTTAVVFHVLFFAAACLTSVAAACRQLRDAPCDDTLLKALHATLPAFAELQRRVQRALAASLPRILKHQRCRRRLRMAIDLTLIPYHGQPEADPKEIYRGQAKRGTSHFHAYASAYLILHGQRYTVALMPVAKGERMENVVFHLRDLAAQAGIRPQLLLLDRGFYSVGVIRHLQAARVPFVMPAIVRGRKPTPEKPATGTRALAVRKRSGWGTHTLKDAQGRPATVSIAIHCGNYRGQWRRHGRFTWLYACWGIGARSTRWVAETYRQRFGIETSYRQLNEARIKTCSRSPALRLLFVALALVLRNVWVWLHWEIVSGRRRGRRRLHLERLRFKTLLSWLQAVAVAALGLCTDIETEREYQQ